MSKTKLIVMGMGFYGRGWAAVAAKHPEAELVAIVDRSEDAMALVNLPVEKYTDLDAAVEAEKPDAVILVVPPHLHAPLAKKLMEKGIAVLCEKPICETLEEAEEMLAVCENGGVCSIAENFRYRPVMRAARKMITDGVIGKVQRISCRYVRNHPDASNQYHGALKHPLLCDVTVHHLDVARYLTGAEPVDVFCKEHAAYHTWYQHRPASAEIQSELSDGSFFTYSGTNASPAPVTDGYGDWEILGDKAVLCVSGTTLTLYTPENEPQVSEYPDTGDTREPLLSGFIRALQENTMGESDIRDNYKTFRWMQMAAQSAECGKALQL